MIDNVISPTVITIRDDLDTKHLKVVSRKNVFLMER